MKITYNGHACFTVESKGFSIVLDPYKDGSVPGLEPVRETADMVLCSHEHGDHGARECVELKSGTENPFIITEIDTFHDPEQGKLRGTNIIRIIDDGETCIAHLGDLGCTLSDEQLELLRDLDVVLIPVGGFYTIDGNQAFDLIEKIEPVSVVPMHFRSDKFGFDVISTLDTFASHFAEKTQLGCQIDTEDLAPGLIVMTPKNQK